MKLTHITKGLSYLEVPEIDLRILCGCPENSIKFLMKKGLTPSVKINGIDLVHGPNAILLNDYNIFNSHILNYSEFPVLHQQYMQGAAFNGTNEKFILIGKKEIVNSQYNYIKRGLFGLTSKEETIEAEISEDISEKFLAIGDFHRGEKKDFNILNKVYIDDLTNIKDELYVKRLSINKFEFIYKNEHVTIDINLSINDKGVGLPYNIENKFIPIDDFLITTVGDGNGWNYKVPCMGALITAGGNRYLVDSGPGSYDLIRHLGVTPSEIKGVFITHSHDDHFAGILSMVNSEEKVKLFATKIVLTSIIKKIEALLNIKYNELNNYFEFIFLDEGLWHGIGDLDVKPFYSFHTIETNVFYFRRKNKDKEWKIYGHINDIISKNDLEHMMEHNSHGIIDDSWAYKWFNHYLEKCDLKRADVGGGAVHGNHLDFVNDESSKIILSHLNNKIDIDKSNKFVLPTEFGHTETLIHTSVNYTMEKVYTILAELGLPVKVLDKINKENISIATPKENVVSKGDEIDSIYLVVSGLVESLSSDGFKRQYIKGDFLYNFNNETESSLTYISSSYSILYKLNLSEFLSHIGIKLNSTFNLLKSRGIFSFGLSLNKLIEFSSITENKYIKKGSFLELEPQFSFILLDGSIDLEIDTKIIPLRKNRLFSYDGNKSFLLKVKNNSNIILFSQRDLEGFPSILWSCFEESLRIKTIVETTFI